MFLSRVLVLSTDSSRLYSSPCKSMFDAGVRVAAQPSRLGLNTTPHRRRSQVDEACGLDIGSNPELCMQLGGTLAAAPFCSRVSKVADPGTRYKTSARFLGKVMYRTIVDVLTFDAHNDTLN